MELKGSVVFVTGANRGLGLEFARAALAGGAAKVYAGMRNTAAFDVPGIIPVQIDVTDQGSVAAAAARCGDVTVLVNNAGIARVMNGPTDANMIELTQELLATNFNGMIRTTQAFASILANNGGGAVINVLSDATWIGIPFLAAYAATKAAAWSYTNSLRLHFESQNTKVVALHVGMMDTDMTRGFDFVKSDPRVIAERAFEGLEAGRHEVLADAGTNTIKQNLSQPDFLYRHPSLPA